MSLNTVGELKDGVSGILSGLNLDKVTGLFKVFERASRKLVQKADIPEASAKESITLYDGVFDYNPSQKIFGNSIVDIRPQGVSRTFLDEVVKQPPARFDQFKDFLSTGYATAFEWNKGVPILRVATPRPLPRVTLDKMHETTDWVAGGSLSALTRDAAVFYESPSSLKFTLTGASVGTLTKTLSSSIDISSYEDVGVAFLATRIPAGSTLADLTSIEFRFGSDDSNYDSVTETDGFLGAWVLDDWLLTAFDFSGATSTGTPDWTAMDYIQLRLTHASGFTNFRVGGLWIAQPSPHEFLYQTAAIFLNGGALAQKITDDDDEIILSDAAYLLYEHECALAIALQKTMPKKAQQIRAILYGREGSDEAGLYGQYRGDNPSQELRTVGSYYEN